MPNPRNLFSNPLTMEFMSGKNELGSFKFTSRFNDKKAYGSQHPNELEIGNIVKIFLDTETSISGDGSFLGVIEELQYTDINSNNLDPKVTISGRGIGAKFEDMIVLHNDYIHTGNGRTRIWASSTPGAIFLDLYEEAVARGCSDNFRPLFTRENDSSGVPWNSEMYFEAQTGSTLADILRQLQDLAVDVRYTHGLEMFNTLDFTNDQVVINQGIQAIETTRSGPIKNKIIATGSSPSAWFENNPSIGQFGRKETLVDGQNYNNEYVANLVLNKLAYPAELSTMSYTYVGAIKSLPFRDYNIGDQIMIETPLYRENNKIFLNVIGITVSQTNDGKLTITPEFGSRREIYETKLQRLFNKLSAGTADGVTSDISQTLSEAAGGGVNMVDLTVQTYDSMLNTGTGIDPYSNIQDFLNGTGEPLGLDDQIGAFMDENGNLIATVVKVRANAFTPTLHLNGAVVAGYPYDTSANGPLSYELFADSDQAAYDPYGYFGLGLETVISVNKGRTYISYFSKELQVSGEIGILPGGSSVNSLHLIGDTLFVTYDTKIYYKKLADATWTLYEATGDLNSGQMYVKEDHATNTIYVVSLGMDSLLKFGKITPTGFVNIGTATNYYPDYNIHGIVAGNGRVVVWQNPASSPYGSKMFYSDGGVLTYGDRTIPTIYGHPVYCIDENKNLSSIFDNGTYWVCERINPINGARANSVITGLPSEALIGQIRGQSALNKLFFSVYMLGSYIDGAPDPGSYYNTLFQYNGASVNITYSDLDNQLETVHQMTSPQYIGGKMRFSVSGWANSNWSSWQYAVTLT